MRFRCGVALSADFAGGSAMNLRESVDCILRHESAALDGFYAHFFERHPQYQTLFQGKSLAAQTAMLTMALAAVQQTPELRQAAVMYLRVLGARHQAVGVPRDAYPDFSESLIETIARFHGADWTDDLAEQWRAALDRASHIMTQAYDEKAPS
jgi:hemoglobin-like flavoprotein